MLTEAQKRQLQEADYRLICGNGAVKLCLWCKKSIKTGGKDFCYKEKWYGIKSHRCLQMTPLITACNLRCEYCWRDHSYFRPQPEDFAKPKELVDEAIAAQKALLTGLGGVDHSARHLKEAQEPLSAAISLDGEPTLYPYIVELVREFHSRGIRTFLVTNGTRPEVLAKMDPLPTNLYLSLSSPTKEIFEKLQHPTSPELWGNIQATLRLFPKLKTNRVVRLTLIKGVNMEPSAYAGHILVAQPDFIEAKAYMFIGGSIRRLKFENMPSLDEVRAFAKKLAELTGYKVADEHAPSRVVLLSKR
ncbi:MAG: 4-demethylwyosine synthase TYW1 [Candidatus Aenigmatarchaeota archaeon]